MTTASIPSRELLTRATGGDHPALNALIDRNEPAILVRAAAAIPSELAELITPKDVADIVRIEAHGRLESWRPQHDGSFLAWLAILADESLMIAAKAQARIKRGGTAARHQEGCRFDREGASPCVALAEMLAPPGRCDCAEPTPTVDWRKHQAELEASLAEHIEEFPEPYAAVVRAVDLRGRKIHEAAAELGRSVGWILMARGHAISRLSGAWPVAPRRA